MPPMQELVSFHIVECDKYNQILMTWTYPTISEENKKYILRKIPIINTINFIYLKNKKEWIYFNNVDVQGADKLSDVNKFTLIIIAKDYNLKKYETLGKILCKCYCKTGSPVQLVKPYLSIYTTGSCSTQENGNFVLREYENNKFAFVKVKDFINMFGLETILIYTAMLLKKRIVIYHHTLEILLKCLQSITALLLHRSPNDYLFPFMENSSEDLLNLKVTFTTYQAQSWFVAGFTDSAICKQIDKFDVLVNLPALEITVMPNAKESLTMTKTHKDIAIHIVQLAENTDLSDIEVSKEINKKTQELLNHLKSLASVSTGNEVMLTVEDLKSKNLHSTLENFLFNLAVAENMMVF